jgi:hypothetical protein
MNGIDTSAAALLANRLSSLQPVGAQPGAGAMQTGVAALAGGTANVPDAAATPPQQLASTQTELSAVALALDAIVRSGGEATPAVVGTAPVWPNPQTAADTPVDAVLAALANSLAEVADIAGAGAALLAAAAGVADAAGAAAQTPAGDAPAQSTASAATASASAVATTADPVAALAASLQRTVSGSGLFYESHLAQWLLGQRSPADLAAEPQNRLVASAAGQLPLDWRRGDADVSDVFWTDPAAPNGPNNGSASPQTSGAADAARAAAERAANALPTTQATLFGDDLLDASSLLPPGQSAAGPSADALLPQAGTQGQPVAVHPAVIPLLRQQLDLLATGEFRWTGEAWPGARLDWSIRQEGDDPRHSRGAPDPDSVPWRTRLTLSLPSLGVVDAELTLVGATLGVRVQANAAGAARLAANGEVLRGRMAAAGIELGGLSIREVGGATPGSGGADATRAAEAYARAAAAPGPAADAPPAAASADDFDWEAS